MCVAGLPDQQSHACAELLCAGVPGPRNRGQAVDRSDNGVRHSCMDRGFRRRGSLHLGPPRSRGSSDASGIGKTCFAVLLGAGRAGAAIGVARRGAGYCGQSEGESPSLPRPFWWRTCQEVGRHEWCHRTTGWHRAPGDAVADFLGPTWQFEVADRAEWQHRSASFVRAAKAWRTARCRRRFRRRGSSLLFCFSPFLPRLDASSVAILWSPLACKGMRCMGAPRLRPWTWYVGAYNKFLAPLRSKGCRLGPPPGGVSPRHTLFPQRRVRPRLVCVWGRRR